MRETPLRHDGAAARNNAGNAICRQRYILQPYAGMDGEIIHALLGLFDQRIAENFPGQVFGLAVDFFQRLIDRHRADRHGRIAQNPFAGFVNVFSGGQVHQRVTTPARRPGHFFDFLFNGRSHRRITDIGVDLDPEIAANNHRLEFGVVDVRGNNRPPPGDFVTHEFRRDFIGNAGAKTLPRMLPQQFFVTLVLAQFLQLYVFANRNIFHLRRDDALARVVHLGDISSGPGTARLANVFKPQLRQFRIILPLPAKFGTRAVQHFRIVALGNPAAAHFGNTLAQIDLDIRIGERAGGVVDGNRRILFRTETGGGFMLNNFAHADADIRARTLHIDLAGAGERLCHFFRKPCGFPDKIVWNCAHCIGPPRKGILRELQAAPEPSLRQHELDQVPRVFLSHTGTPGS